MVERMEVLSSKDEKMASDGKKRMKQTRPDDCVLLGWLILAILSYVAYEEVPLPTCSGRKLRHCKEGASFELEEGAVSSGTEYEP